MEHRKRVAGGSGRPDMGYCAVGRAWVCEEGTPGSPGLSARFLPGETKPRQVEGAERPQQKRSHLRAHPPVTGDLLTEPVRVVILFDPRPQQAFLFCPVAQEALLVKRPVGIQVPLLTGEVQAGDDIL